MPQLRLAKEIYPALEEDLKEAGLEFRFCSKDQRYERNYTCKKRQAADMAKIGEIIKKKQKPKQS